MDSLAEAEAEADLGGADAMDSFPGEKSPAEKASKNSEMEVNSISEFDYDILVPLGPK